MNWQDLYRARVGSLDVSRTGELKTRDDFVCVRAITHMDLATQWGAAKTQTADTLDDTICFEVLGVGPLVKDIEVGDHLEYIASTADALQAFGDESVFYVREKWIPAKWNPVLMAEKLTAIRAADAEAKRQRMAEAAEAAEAIAAERAALVRDSG